MSQRPLKMPTKFLAALVPLVLALGACGDNDDTTSSDTAASTSSDIPRLTFDGSGCVYEGPQEVTAGVVAVELVNDSDGSANVFVGRIDEGTTVQDVIDDAGTEPTSRMSPWLTDMGAQRPARAGETMRWESSLAAGEYFVTCTSRAGGWAAFGTGLTVVNG